MRTTACREVAEPMRRRTRLLRQGNAEVEAKLEPLLK